MPLDDDAMLSPLSFDQKIIRDAIQRRLKGSSMHPQPPATRPSQPREWLAIAAHGP